jgi:RNA polymerase sigma-54 factor
MFISQEQLQHQIITAHLTQTMELISLTTLELRQRIEEEAAVNPILQIVEEYRCPHCRRILAKTDHCPVCSHSKQEAVDQAIVFVSWQDRYWYGGNTYEADTLDDPLGAAPIELPEYVLSQIAPDLQPIERQIAVDLLHSLDSNGFLDTSIFDVARYHHVLPSQVERVLHLVQRANPPGIGARDYKEALLVQLEILSETQAVPPLARKVIQEGLPLLARHQYSKLAALLGTTIDEVRDMAQFFAQNLNPYPSQAHWGESYTARRPNNLVFYQPDIVISHLNGRKEDPLVVEVLMPVPGTVQIDREFCSYLASASKETREKWQEEFNRASLLAKCTQHRNNTLTRLMKELVSIQQDFILRGDAFLKPLTQAKMAEKLGVHESTVSRAVNGKRVLLPNKRMVPLKHFFQKNMHIRKMIKQIIEEEVEPLSDSQIAKLLADQGLSIARRTVAKYRQNERIPSVHIRRRQKESSA